MKVRGMSISCNRIPKRMSFFWASSPLSWLRYLTLYSFRWYNPEWEITLHRADVGACRWKSSESQDSQNYSGPDHMSLIAELEINVVAWKPLIEQLAPAHASDLCQWETLAGPGGFYCDMDILFVRPVPYESMCTADVVCCLSNGYMAIGFFGGSPDNQMFRDVLQEAQKGYRDNVYQSTGAEAIYRLSGVKSPWQRVKRPGCEAVARLRKKYASIEIQEVPSATIYPWAWNELEQIFVAASDVPEECVGIHWFGGRRLAQEWNKRLTIDTVGEYYNTLTRYISKL